ncbi:MAG: PASTA domain-containing protein [Alistipes sp.]|nr:PASTA domain-containing protein [Alistipes senegalensis]MCM1250799.1 PASTA domain-containing protein [Alistipes sp.]
MEKYSSFLNRFRYEHPLIFNLAIIAAIILMMALAAHAAMHIGTRHGSRRRVPDFSGVPLLEAQRMARKNDLRLQINDSLFVPAYEGGIVLDQLPQGGVEVKPGRTVYITINSFRQKMVPVPYVADRSLRQAKNMLEIAGLEIGELIYRTDMATNYVLDEYLGKQRITPSSRIEAEMGSGVTLHVGVQPGHRSTVVPQVIGLSLKDAKSRLWELGLNVGKVAFDDGINLLNQKDARVYMQNPVAERNAVLGAKVNLQLTLDTKKVTLRLQEAEEQADEAFRKRLQRLEEEKNAASAAEKPAAAEPTPTPAEEPDAGFFD